MRHTILIANVLLLLWSAGCTFDSAVLESRRCETSEDCSAQGEGLVCLSGYCQQPEAQCSADADCAALLTDLEACEVATCGAGGQCEAQPAPTGTACAGSGTCAPGRCDDAGACVIVPDDTLCANGLFCDGDEVCQPGAADADERGCVAGAPPVVDDGVACTVGSCDEEADQIVQDCDACECCGEETACGEGRNAPQCFAWVCSESYTCQLAPSAPGDACDDGVPCTAGDACDAEQNCVGAPSDGICDDGVFCNGSEACDPDARNRDEQGCVPGADILSDGINCTIDSCDEESDVVNHDTSGCECEGDSDCQARCFVGACVNAVCTFEPASAGSPCNDGLTCTAGDACDAEQNCVGTPDDAACDDGLYCSGVERCAPDDPSRSELGCVTTRLMIDDGLACTVDSCDEENDQIIHDESNCECESDADCEATCRVGACVNSACVFEPEPVGTACDDGVACTMDDACDASQQCRGRADDASCSDGAFCNGAETCQPDSANQDEQGCVVGTLEIDDGVPCTRDFCDEDADRLVNDPTDCECRSDADCVETCRVGTCDNFACTFVDAPGATCDDGVACTTDDTCTDALTCVGTPNNPTCSDGAFCNGAETCQPDSNDADDDGCVPGLAPNVDDGLTCTEDSCDEVNDVIVNDTAACQCIGDDDCQDTACATFRCDNGACVVDAINNDAVCDDGIACTGDGVCQEDGSCAPGAADDASCSDGAFCNGAETCQPASPTADGDGCVPGVDPLTTAPDPSPCEVLSCDEQGDAVVVDDSACCVAGSEGPFYDASCFDGFDNDCNGDQDGADGACAFAPAQFPGLILWLDATVGVDIGTFGGVSDWDDRSGSGNDGEGDFLDWLRPRRRDNAQNGRRVVDFDGGDDRIYIDDSNDFNFGDTATFFVVFKVDGLSSDWQALITQGDSSWRIHRFGDTDKIAFGTNTQDGAQDLASTSPINDGAYHIVAATFNSGEKRLYFDGRLEGTVTTGSRINNSNRGIRVGDNDERSDRNWNGRVGEIIVYNGFLNETQRRAIEVALAQRWGLTLREP